MIDVQWSLGEHGEDAEGLLADWAAEDVASRLWARDTTLWSPDPATPELADRLGWLDLPETSEALGPDLANFAAGIPFWMTDLVLLGMGGSSLAPEVLARTIGGGGLPLTVMDSTHPQAVRDLEWINPANTIFIVASKSGTTLETLSLFRHFWSRTREVVEEPGAHFVAITDPGSPLVDLARERGFRAVFEAPSDLGGRFSALSPFGLVPAALMGLDVATLLSGAVEAADACREPAPHNPGLRLGAALAGLARTGRDKVTFVTRSQFDAFPDWIEQLIAESTGKDGTGLVPIAREPQRDVGDYGSDRVVVGVVSPASVSEASAKWGEEDDSLARLEALAAEGHPVIRIEIDREDDLGGLFFVSEVAVAMVGSALGIHPFNQPDVEFAKQLAREAMARPAVAAESAGEPYDAPEEPRGADVGEIDLAWEIAPYGHANPATPAEPDVMGIEDGVDAFLDELSAGDYVGIQAYLAGGDEEELEELQHLRDALTTATGAATTLGYGPRFLHSTGQLHKGGPDRCAFLQLVDDAGPHVPVPETEFTFHQLIRAQSHGDLAALSQRGRRVLRVRVGPSTEGIGRLIQVIERER